MKHVKEIHSGFILPTVLVLSLTIVTIMVALLVVTTSSFGGSYVDHYQKLSDEAAEAGTAYATACLNLSGHVQTWGAAVSKPDLVPNKNCSGTTISPAISPYVYSDSMVRTYFVVGNLDYSAPFSAQVSSKGYAQVLKSDGSVEKTYESGQKKIITWPTEITGQMSASGTNRTCAVVNYAVYCWGLNRFGQLGNGQYVGAQTSAAKSTDSPPENCPCDPENASLVDSKMPVKVTRATGVMAGKKIVKIFAAQYHSCALSDDGLMYCWGYNNSGQLGTGNRNDSAVPVQVGGALTGQTITDIGGTGNTSCAIAKVNDSGGKIYCWGSNGSGSTLYGTVGRNSSSPTAQTDSPILVVAGNTSDTLPTSYLATALSTSGSRSYTMCAIAGGKAYCWGQNEVGSVGNNSTSVAVTLPTKVYDSGVLSGKIVTAISQDGFNKTRASGGSGEAHVCAIANGSVYCWGENYNGQLGNGSYGTSVNSQPVTVSANSGDVLYGKTIQSIQVGLGHSCVRADNGAYCWGDNSSGQVGNNSGTSRLTKPTAVWLEAGALTASNVISIGAGAHRGCATIDDGRTFCWGLNNNGQIGDGTSGPLAADNTRIKPTYSLFLRPSGNQYIF